MSDSKLREILQQELARSLRDELKRHQETPWGQPLYAFGAEGSQVRKDDLEALEGFLSEARGDLVNRHTSGMVEWVDELMERHQLPDELRNALAFGLLKIRVQRLEKSKEWLQHGPVEDIAEVSQVTNVVDVTTVAVPTAPSDARKLSDRLPDFLDLMTRDEGWRGQTLAQNQATYRFFVECCGDRPPNSYAKRDLASFYDTMRKLPALYSKKPEWRGLSLAEIVERTRGLDVERLTMKTVKRHFSALGRLFDYFKRRGEYSGENPAYGFEFPKKGRSKDDRQMWEGDKLSKLFASPVWSGCASESRRSKPGATVVRDDKYWLPLLGLYHGNRLEEFAQLRREDIKQQDGTLYFYIHDGGERQIKNEQSRRRVPIHPTVLAMGFMGYVEQAAPNAHDMVFPELNPGGPDGKYGYYFTKWWTNYRRSVGVYEKRLDYHSFRHGVTTKLYAAGVSEAIVDELTGHEGQGTSRVVYKKDMPLSVLLEAISKVEWTEVKL